MKRRGIIPRRLPRPVLFAGIAAGLLAAGMAGTAWGKTPTWWKYDRPATYDSIEAQIMVPTRDGTGLSCLLRRPGVGAEPVAGRRPVIVTNFFPYAIIRNTFTEANYFTTHGYVTLDCDVRGTGNSEGTYPGILDAQEARDNYDLIEWAAAQEWSNGVVGQEGVSYGAMTSFRVAALQPPHLVAIAPRFGAESVYLDGLYPGGISSANHMEIAGGVFFLSGGRTDPVAQLQTFLDHPLHDAYWDQFDVFTKWPQIRVPALMQGGWYDYFRRGGVLNYQGLKDRSWLVMGPWFHNSGINWDSDDAPKSDLPRGAYLAWFDHWLMRRHSAPLPSAKVTAWRLPDGGWHEFADFPNPSGGTLRLRMRSDGRLARRGGVAGAHSYAVNPNDGPSTLCFPEPPPPSPCGTPDQDERVQDARRLTFTTRPLRRGVTLAGLPTVHLRAALTAANGNFVARLSDVSPDGYVREASVGYLRASHRLSHDFEVFPTPGVSYRHAIEVEPVYWRYRKGHRIRISLSSGDYPRIDANAEPGMVTVESGRGGSFVDLPLP